MSDAEFEMVIDLILGLGLIFLSFVYTVACSRWADELIEKCKRLQDWIERERRS